MVNNAPSTDEQRHPAAGSQEDAVRRQQTIDMLFEGENMETLVRLQAKLTLFQSSTS